MDDKPEIIGVSAFSRWADFPAEQNAVLRFIGTGDSDFVGIGYLLPVDLFVSLPNN
jgi:hypothetical protein